MSVPRRAYDLLRGYIGREYDRIQGLDLDSASKELSESMATTRPPAANTGEAPKSQVDRDERARNVLGVSKDADFAAIRAAFDRLNRRSDPTNFPPGSPEAQQAGQIQRRVRDAYRFLADRADATEVRFKSLELN